MFVGQLPGSNNYRALFYRTEGGRVVAGLGQAANGKGIAYVADTEGVHRADLAVGADGKAKISISDSTAKDVAVLTEGERSAGLFTLYGSGGQPMVVAGVDAGGFGVVRAGPESFKPGFGLLGLPGSYIAGKP